MAVPIIPVRSVGIGRSPRPAGLEHLKRLRKGRPETGLVGIAGGWEDPEELAATLDASLPVTGNAMLWTLSPDHGLFF